MVNQVDELITTVQTYKAHIVAITETSLHDQINDAKVAINDYYIFRNDREGRGGGALLFIKSSLRPNQQIQLKHFGTPLTDIVSLTFAISNTALNVLCVYHTLRVGIVNNLSNLQER